ncbi:MAG: aminopeptidase P family protein [Magnetovibrio sp.]|nr:aminopeptidase P family protein [Magnetovibrio sp.]
MLKHDLQALRLTQLRAQMQDRGLSAYLVPRADGHQNEYVPPSAERLKWISGFDGTAGLAVIGLEHAAMFVDGRYTLQVKDQCPAELWQHLHITDNPVELWLQRYLSSGDKIGFDPRLHTPSGLTRIQTVMKNLSVDLIEVDHNLIDELWKDRPASPQGAVVLHPKIYCGESSIHKRKRIAAILSQDGFDAVVVSSPDNLSWLLNIRGNDLEMTPVVLGYVILNSDATVFLFVQGEKINAEVREALENDGVEIAEPEDFVAALQSLADKSVRIDRATGSVFICEVLRAAGAKVDVGADPCTADKAHKNDVEIQGIKNAHVRDGVALVRFFNWFKRHVPGDETEWTVSEKLGQFRACGTHYKSPSFQTISAVGKNGAIVHYGLKQDQASPLTADELYLVDSGGQYLDGTTDVTRVLAIGTPTAEMIRRYTQVLKGHIAVSSARFPVGTTGAQLDPLARQFLWADGVDYDHGTGHGVGSYLSVHEGPQSISKRSTAVSLDPGMVLSIEPGYYKAGAFGIRIENLVVVQNLIPPPKSAEREMLCFEPLTLAPFERRLIDTALLSDAEKQWINDYYRKICHTLTPHLEAEDADFLVQETQPFR